MARLGSQHRQADSLLPHYIANRSVPAPASPNILLTPSPSWLAKLATVAEPGPIDNSSVICRWLLCCSSAPDPTSSPGMGESGIRGGSRRRASVLPCLGRWPPPSLQSLLLLSHPCSYPPPQKSCDRYSHCEFSLACEYILSVICIIYTWPEKTHCLPRW